MRSVIGMTSLRVEVTALPDRLKLDVELIRIRLVVGADQTIYLISYSNQKSCMFVIFSSWESERGKKQKQNKKKKENRKREWKK